MAPVSLYAGWLVLAVTVLFCMPKTISGFSRGGPPGNCILSYAKHGISQQTSPPPYKIQLSAESYRPGDNITVTLSSDIGQTFRGHQLRARRVDGADDTQQVIGAFLEFPDQSVPQNWLGPEGVEYNCVTHKDSSDKTEQVFVWNAPHQTEGDLVFVAGFVKNFSVFWYDVRSTAVRAVEPYLPPPYHSHINPDFDKFLFMTSCGDTLGCFFYPSGCHGDDCQYVISYEPINNGSSVRFQFMAGDVGERQGASVAFSDDVDMGKEIAFNCLRNGDSLDIQNRYHPSYHQTPQRITDFRDMHIAYHNGRLYCSLVRDTVMTFTHAGYSKLVTSDLTKKYYVMIAVADLYKGTDIVEKHVALPIVSRQKVDLFEQTIIHGGHSLPIMLQLHATFGLMAFLLLAGFGMLLPRHFRREIRCGKPVWQESHLAVMVITCTCASVGVVLVFVHLRQWTKHATLHAIFGLLAVGFMLINLVYGLLRPGPISHFRKAFAWIHRVVGILGYVMSAVCVYLGCFNGLVSEALRNKLAVTVTIGYGVQILVLVVLELTKCMSEKHTQKTKVSRTAGGLDVQERVRSTKTQNGNIWAWKIFCIITYSLSMVAVIITAVYLIFTI